MYLTFNNQKTKKLNFIIFILSLIAAVSFLFTGYRSVVLFEKKFPFSVILSSFIMIVWYISIFRNRKELAGNKFLLILYFYLILATAGAWAVAFIKIAKLPLELYAKASTSFFLNMITEGFLYPSALFLTRIYISHSLKNEDQKEPTGPLFIQSHTFHKVEYLAFTVIFLFSPSVFLAGIFSELSFSLKIFLRISLFLSNAAACYLLFSFFIKWKDHSINGTKQPIPLAIHMFLFLKPFAGMAAAFSPDQWFTASSYRIIYLHAMLLGGTSLMIFYIMQQQIPGFTKYFRNMQFSSVFVVAGMFLFLFPFLSATAPTIAVLITAMAAVSSGMLLFSMVRKIKWGS